MRSLIIVTLIVFSSTVCAQNTRDIQVLFEKGQKLVSANPDSVYLIISEIELSSREIKYNWGFVQADLLRAWVTYWDNDLEAAAKLLLEVIDRAENLRGESYEEGRARTLLGLVYKKFNEYDKAQEQIIRASNSYLAMDCTRNYGGALSNLGTLEGMKGNYPEALSYFIESRQIARSVNNSELLRSSLINISVANSLMNNHEEAISTSKEVLAISIREEDSLSIAYNLIIVAENFKEAELLDSAIYYNQEVVDYVKSHFADHPKYKSFIYEAYQNNAAIYYDKGSVEEAKSLLFSSLRLRSKNENTGIEDSYTLLANYHQDQQNIDSAIFYSMKALNSSIRNRSKRSARGAAKRLSSIYRQTKRYDSALFYSEMYHTYNDSLYNESNERKFSNLKIEMATAEKQSEIDLLKKQKEIDKTERKLLLLSMISVATLAAFMVTILILRQRNKNKEQLLKEAELKSEVGMKEHQLQQQALHMINMSNRMTEVEETLKSVRKKQNFSSRDLQTVLSNIKVSKSMDSEWKRFEEYFSNFNPEFYEKLAKEHDSLTHQERRIAALIKLGLNNREISNLLNIEQKSVSMNRYRLKKKLGLLDQEDLTSYLQKL